MTSLFPALRGATADRPALRFGDRSLTYGQLAAATGALAGRLARYDRVAVWATAELETAVAVVAALEAGVAAVPLNPKSGEKELGHILNDSRPGLLLVPPGAELPAAVGDLERVDIDVHGTGGLAPDSAAQDGDPALVVYTSGTTGPPKGAVLPAGQSPPLWTPSPTPGSGRRTTSWCTACPSSMCTAWSWASSARSAAAARSVTWAGSARTGWPVS